MARKPARDWIFISEAAGIIGVSRVYIHNLLRSGFFPNAATDCANYLLYKPEVLRVKEARDAGLFPRGRSPSDKPLMTYSEMCKELKAIAGRELDG